MKSHLWDHSVLVLLAISSVAVGCSRADEGRLGGTGSPGTEPHPKGLTLQEQARELGLKYPLRKVFLRAFKEERRLELWASNGVEPMRRVRSYAIAAASGGPGPKRREGDLQVPEGVYRIDRFNPRSRFHLSLGLDYPNASDRLRGAKRPGDDIFIHGNRVSIGCLAMTDRVIDEIYSLCEKAANRKAIPVHIFPCRMDGLAMDALLRRHPEHRAFWRELRPVYDAFERTRRVPKVLIGTNGDYQVRPKD